MSEKNDGGPAFPMRSEPHYTPDSKWEIEQKGMSLRDYLAAAALDPLIYHELYSGTWKHICPSSLNRIAADAYQLADAMIAARDK
jgi:hypothetical protein